MGVVTRGLVLDISQPRVEFAVDEEGLRLAKAAHHSVSTSFLQKRGGGLALGGSEFPARVGRSVVVAKGSRCFGARGESLAVVG